MEPESRLFQLLRDLVRRETEFRRRALRRALSEIDDRQTARRLHGPAQLAEVGRPVRDVMVRVDDEHHVDRFGQVGAIGAALNGDHLRQALFGRPLFDVLHHRRLDVDGIDPRPSRRVRQSNREVPGAGADVGDRLPGRQGQRVDDPGRHLPRVARRIVERFGVPLRIVEAVLHVTARRTCLARRSRRLRVLAPRRSEGRHAERERDRRRNAVSSHLAPPIDISIRRSDCLTGTGLSSRAPYTIRN
jgi:hypothetical protein